MEKEKAWIFAEQIKQLHFQQPAGMGASIAFGAGLVGVLWNHAPHVFLVSWYATLSGILLVRAIALFLFWRKRKPEANLRTWENVANLLLIGTGTSWGAASFAVLQNSAILHNLLVVFVLVGMIAGAAGTLSARRRSYYSFAIPAAILSITSFLLPGDPLHTTIAIGLAFLFVVASAASEGMYRLLEKSFRLGFRNIELINTLQESNARTEAMNKKLLEENAMRRKAEDGLRELSANLEKQVELRTQELSRANRELEAFSHSVSHDLRGPLTSIEGNTWALEEEYQNILDENGKQYLSAIRSSVDRMGQLIKDLLSLSLMNSTNLHSQQVDLSPIGREIAASLQSREPARHVEFAIQESIPALCDANLIRIALENLLGNAWKFTSKCETARIEFGFQTKESRPVYFVMDNGAGFDMASSEKLFQPFQRLHPSSEFKGTGVGLATVQRIIHRHGGTIWAESEKGNGAAFYFVLAESKE